MDAGITGDTPILKRLDIETPTKTKPFKRGLQTANLEHLDVESTTKKATFKGDLGPQPKSVIDLDPDDDLKLEANTDLDSQHPRIYAVDDSYEPCSLAHLWDADFLAQYFRDQASFGEAARSYGESERESEGEGTAITIVDGESAREGNGSVVEIAG